MKKILFFIDPDWVFGKIHQELIKALYPDFYCDLKPWAVSMTSQEGELFKNKYDLFVSTPTGCFVLHENYHIPMNKLVGIIHGDFDVYSCLDKIKDAREKFKVLGGYAAIWPNGQNMSISYGIDNIPEFLPIGIFTELYEIQKPKPVETCGYFCKPQRIDRGIDIKRGDLVKLVCEKTKIKLKQCSNFNFLVADQLYKGVDFVMFASLMEGNPYPALEAFASGIPVIGTKVGIFGEYAKTGAGVVLPFQKEAFIKEAQIAINNWVSNPEAYVEACNAALRLRSKLDWKSIKPLWVEFLNQVLEKQ